jgi:hypothetical protein
MKLFLTLDRKGTKFQKNYDAGRLVVVKFLINAALFSEADQNL